MNRFVSLLIVLAVWLSARIVFFEGFWGYDDLSHVVFAWQPRVPVEVFECRWLYNVLLIGVFQCVGYSEAAAAVPTMAASLMMVLTVWHIAGRAFGPTYGCLAGLLLSLVALDVSQSTVPMANPLAAALAGLGTVFVVHAERRRSWALSGILLGLAVNTHLATAFYFGPLLVVSFAVRPSRSRLLDSATMLAATVATFGILEVLMSLWFSGTPLHRLGIIESTHLSTQVKTIPFLLADGHVNPEWFLWPLRSFVVSRELGFVLSLSVIGAVLLWRRLDHRGRTLLALVGFSWLYINFGTQQLSQYAPLDHQVRYWYPILVPLALLAITVAKALESRRGLRRAYLAAMFVPLPLLLSVAGPWGQNVEISRSLLEYAQQNPDETFVTDLRTYEEFFLLNACRHPANVRVWSDTESLYFDDEAVFTNPDKADAFLLNTMNFDRGGTEEFSEFARTQLSLQQVAPPRTRLLTRLLPQSIRPDHAALIRRPPAVLGRATVQSLSSSAWTTRSR